MVPDRLRSGDGASRDDVTVSFTGAWPAGGAPGTPEWLRQQRRWNPSCGVLSGPTYTPTGNIPSITVLERGGNMRYFPFRMAASFYNMPEADLIPSCCSVRQYIKWDQRYVDSKQGLPNPAFPPSTPVNTWIEDRSPGDYRYG
jgi:hypothetical protein